MGHMKTIHILIGMLSFAVTAMAGVPQLMNYQGRLTNDMGEPLDTTVSITFTIYDDSTGGTVQWSEVHPSVSVVSGLFDVILGAIVPIDDSIFVDANRWLAITVDGEAINRRSRMVSSPYSMCAATVDEPLHLEHDADYNPAIKAENHYQSEHSEGSLGGYFDGVVGKVSYSSGRAVRGEHETSGHYGYLGTNHEGVYGRSSDNYIGRLAYGGQGGVWGENPDGTRGVLGGPSAAVTGYNAVTGNGGSIGFSAYGISAYSETGYAGYFVSTDSVSGGNNRAAVHALYTPSGEYSASAVYGKCDLEGGYGTGGYFSAGWRGVAGVVVRKGIDDYAYGVYGNVWGTGEVNYGIYGEAHDGNTNWAGYFEGNCRVTGTFDNSKSRTVMDHPLDPEHKYLYHCAIVSPEMKNIYDGVVTTNSNGIAVVVLPDYFSLINKDFRYQLTVIGEFAQAIIAQKIAGNQFTIQTDKPFVEVSWQVTGIRDDAYARANPMEVEVEKPRYEAGKYLHPEAYGQPEYMDIHYEMHQHDNRYEEPEPWEAWR